MSTPVDIHGTNLASGMVLMTPRGDVIGKVVRFETGTAAHDDPKGSYRHRVTLENHRKQVTVRADLTTYVTVDAASLPNPVHFPVRIAAHHIKPGFEVRHETMLRGPIDPNGLEGYAKIVEARQVDKFTVMLQPEADASTVEMPGDLPSHRPLIKPGVNARFEIDPCSIPDYPKEELEQPPLAPIPYGKLTGPWVVLVDMAGVCTVISGPAFSDYAGGESFAGKDIDEAYLRGVDHEKPGMYECWAIPERVEEQESWETPKYEVCIFTVEKQEAFIAPSALRESVHG
jgi:hypothetical protein